MRTPLKTYGGVLLLCLAVRPATSSRARVAAPPGVRRLRANRRQSPVRKRPEAVAAPPFSPANAGLSDIRGGRLVARADGFATLPHSRRRKPACPWRRALVDDRHAHGVRTERGSGGGIVIRPLAVLHTVFRACVYGNTSTLLITTRDPRRRSLVTNRETARRYLPRRDSGACSDSTGPKERFWYQFWLFPSRFGAAARTRKKGACSR